jgi:3-hydroxy acid dehydrogenase / malonic semialdehyde reductase
MQQKNIIITGATSGFGEAIATLFAKYNYTVIITGRRQQRLQQLQLTLQQQYNATVHQLCFDVRNAKATQEAFAQLPSLGINTIDILVNNAGLAAGFGSIQDGDINNWDTMIDTNVKGLLYVSKSIIPYMQQQGFGHIINIGSIAGKYVYKNGNVYCASKHAVDAIGQSMRIDLLPYGIKVTNINPGAAYTEFSLVRFDGDKAKADAVYDGYTPLSAQDIADTTWYVANLPKHVCVNDITLTCLTQADSHYNIKQG